MHHHCFIPSPWGNHKYCSILHLQKIRFWEYQSPTTLSQPPLGRSCKYNTNQQLLSSRFRVWVADTVGNVCWHVKSVSEAGPKIKFISSWPTLLKLAVDFDYRSAVCLKHREHTGMFALIIIRRSFKPLSYRLQHTSGDQLQIMQQECMSINPHHSNLPLFGFSKGLIRKPLKLARAYHPLPMTGWSHKECSLMQETPHASFAQYMHTPDPTAVHTLALPSWVSCTYSPWSWDKQSSCGGMLIAHAQCPKHLQLKNMGAHTQAV